MSPDPVFGDPARWGVTRLAAQTGLDTLGLPVWSALRPASLSLCVTNGKGLSEADARRGALAEAIECACAEDAARIAPLEASIGALRAGGRAVLDVTAFACARTEVLDEARPRRWASGRSLLTDAPVLAPFEMVGLDLAMPSPWDGETFALGSVGLAVHVDRGEAIARALLEAAENDARALALEIEGAALACPRLAPASLALPWLQAMAPRLARVGLAPELVVITADTGLPAVLCLLREDGPAARRFRHAGAACRGTERAAAEAAIMEALQSRLTDIAGARDDIAPEHYGLRPEPEPAAAPARPVAEEAGPAIPAPEAIARRLMAAGCGEPVVFDLAPEGCGFHCVRVLVPGLELADEGRRPRRGARFRAAGLRAMLTPQGLLGGGSRPRGGRAA